MEVKYRTVKLLKNKIEEYFSNDDLMFTPTFHGLRLYLELDINEFNKYSDGEYDSDKRKFSSEIEFAVLKIADILERKIIDKLTYTPGLRTALLIIHEWLNRSINDKNMIIDNKKRIEEKMNKLLKGNTHEDNYK